MAPSCRSLALLLGCSLAARASALAPAAAPVRAQQPISVDAASSQVDYKTNTVVFTQVVISQGTTRVQAEHAHATGLEFANSRWTFEGDVHIEAQEQGTLRSDVAIVEFRDNHIARATITGKPAQFEQRRADSDKVARGHADEIVYDVAAGTVRLSNDAWLSNGQNEISGPLLVYSMREQRVEAATAPGTGQHIHITISGHEAAKTDSGKAPSPQP
jgi:lipopolysaccharide transport protein LptA